MQTLSLIILGEWTSRNSFCIYNIWNRGQLGYNTECFPFTISFDSNVQMPIHMLTPAWYRQTKLGLNLNFFMYWLIWTNSLAFLTLSFLTLIPKPRVALRSKWNNACSILRNVKYSVNVLYSIYLFSFLLFLSRLFLIPHHWIDVFFTSYDQRRSSAMSIRLHTHLLFFWTPILTSTAFLVWHWKCIWVSISTYPAVKWYQYSSFAWKESLMTVDPELWRWKLPCNCLLL